MTDKKHVLLTGANGFVGQKLYQYLNSHGYLVRQSVRQSKQTGSSIVSVGNMDGCTEWNSALEGIDSVVHLAARVHIQKPDVSDALELFRAVNRDGTLNLARQAVAAGVRRFVYLSSIKVNGESTGRVPFREGDTPAPVGPYALSKWEAEQGLLALARETDLEVVIIRPPLVYGSEVKANFLNLLRITDKGIPLPLANIDNCRSLVSLDNLVDFISICLEHPAAIGGTFLISDGEDVSTPDLIRMIAGHMNKPARLFSFPQTVLKMAARIIRKELLVNRLTESLQLDSSKARQLLNWRPPYSLDESLKKTVDWYTSSYH